MKSLLESAIKIISLIIWFVKVFIPLFLQKILNITIFLSAGVLYRLASSLIKRALSHFCQSALFLFSFPPFPCAYGSAAFSSESRMGLAYLLLFSTQSIAS